MIIEHNRGSNQGFDQGPNPITPLSPDARLFLSTYRQSQAFEFTYNGNLYLTTELSHLSDVGRRKAVWSRAFVERLFSLQTLEEADSLLEPWSRWMETHSQVWHPYYSFEGHRDSEAIHAHYDECNRQFNAVDVPSEIKQYQGDLKDDEIKSLAKWEIFGLTRKIKGAIELIEGVQKPAMLDAVFLVQRTIGKAFTPVAGLEDKYAIKRDVRRVTQDGVGYVGFPGDGDLLLEDTATDADWERWNQLDSGMHTRYLKTDWETKVTTLESGIVQGFDFLGAGDEMLFAPSVGLIGIITRNDTSGLFQCPLVRDIRLDHEEVTEVDLNPPVPDESVTVTTFIPQTGLIIDQKFDSMDTAAEAVKNQLEHKLSTDRQAELN